MQINFVPIHKDCEKYLVAGQLYHVMKGDIIRTLQAGGTPNGRTVLYVPLDIYEQEGYWFVDEFEMIEDLWG